MKVHKGDMKFMNKVFSEINGCFGFGMMRLPLLEEASDGKPPVVDLDQTSAMVDLFIDEGFNYFDTAHGYLDYESEIAVGKCLSARHDRSEYLLANKLTGDYFKTREDIRPFFMKQLETCGVEYFDFYLVHSVCKGNYPHFQECHAYEEALKLKEEGYIRHLGMSFHDTADFLEEVLSDHPEVEFVQLQVNYIDYEDEAVQSRRCIEVCQKHGLGVSVMEPIRGGSLAVLPDAANGILSELGDASPSSYALRFAAGCEGVYITLSGMSTLEQMKQNIETMKAPAPLNDKEMEAIKKISETFRTSDFIPCTACRYCTAGCPANIDIPAIFAAMNHKTMFGNGWNADFYYSRACSSGKPADCLKCGLCEASCPQHLEIRELLEKVANAFAKKEEE